MAKAKAKTVKAKVVVFYDSEGHYTAAGDWTHYHKKRPSSDTLLAEADNLGVEDLPYACIVDVELPIPKPLEGNVVTVTKVNP